MFAFLALVSPMIWARIALAAALAGGAFWGYHHVKQIGWNERDVIAQADDAARKAAENKAVAARMAENETKAKQFEADKIKLKKGYANEIAQINADRATDVRLRISSAVCDGFTGTAKSDSTGRGATDPSTTRLLPPAVNRNILDLMDQADTAVAGCRVLQEFVKSQGMAP